MFGDTYLKYKRTAEKNITVATKTVRDKLSFRRRFDIAIAEKKLTVINKRSNGVYLRSPMAINTILPANKTLFLYFGGKIRYIIKNAGKNLNIKLRLVNCILSSRKKSYETIIYKHMLFHNGFKTNVMKIKNLKYCLNYL
jgi:hypothetical protein